MRIDAHQHLWDLTVRDQPWTAELPVLRRSFAMSDLAPALDAHGIAGTILVQTVTVQEETPEFLALAAKVPVRTNVEAFPLEAANEALAKLRRGDVRGAIVLQCAVAGP